MNTECQALSAAHAGNSNTFDLNQTLPYNETYFSNIPDDQDWKIEKVVAAIDKDEGRFYKVKWVRYLWQTEESLQSTNQLITDYWLNNGNDISLDVSSLSCSSDEKLVLNDISSTEKHIDISNVSCSTFNNYHTPSVNLYSSAEKHQSPPDILYSSTEKHHSPPDIPLHVRTHLSLPAVVCSTKESEINVPGILCSTEKNSESSLLETPYVQTSGNNTNIIAVQINEDAEIEDNESIDGDIHSQVLHYNTDESITRIEEKFINPSTIINFTINSFDYKKFKCELCDKSFDRKTSLQRHALIHTGEKPFHCNYCSKSFNQNAILQRHLLIHANSKSFLCDICGKTFVEKGALYRHRVTHDGEKNWVCEICGKKFILKEYLSKHVFLHSGKRPYPCDKCGHRFADSSAFKRHQKVHHHRDSDYACEVCQKQHKNLPSLKKHQKHCGTMSYHQCVICKIKFDNKELLKMHRQTHLPPFLCNSCNVQFQNYDEYGSHIATHNVKTESEIREENVLTDEKDHKNHVN